jgi:transcriptional regulator with XRE-family HTH domain
VKDLHLTMQIRNNRLRERRVSLGMTAAQLCKALGMDSCQTAYGKLEKLTLSPLRSRILPVCRVPECNNVAAQSTRCRCKEHLSIGIDEFPTKRAEPTWTKLALALAAFYKCDPIELFPVEILQIGQSSHEKTVNVEEIAAYLPPLSSEQLALPADIALEQAEAAYNVSEALKRIRPSEANVIRQRFGLGDCGEHCVSDIGEDMRLSITRVCQIERKALTKLRKILKK